MAKLELEREAHGDFVEFPRNSLELFQEMLQRLTPRLTKKDTTFWKVFRTALVANVHSTAQYDAA